MNGDGSALRSALILVGQFRTRIADHEAQIRDLLEEREELLTEIVRLQRGNHPAGRALPHLALAEALTERDAEHEGGWVVSEETEVREEWALRWSDGTVSGSIYSGDGSDAAERQIRALAPDADEVVHRTVTIHRTPWEPA